MSWFRTSSVWTVRTINYDGHASYSKFRTLRVQTVSVEGLMKGGKRDLDDEENVTDVKKGETNEERQTRLVNLCRHLHISVMRALHINWLGEE